ncbi:MAG: hypothetical protein LUD68_03115 [Rikenellaceae bacterium]|nr:hypothetical protein [Rikenellaceae bacterium]
MKEQYIHIEGLIERFLDGATTLAEEKELFRFFSQSHIPEHLERYQAMFMWFDGALKKEFNRSSAKTVPVEPGRRLWVWAAAAAVAAAVVFLMIHTPGHTEFNPFEGSYLVRNGTVISDSEQIRPIVEATLRAVEEKELEILRILVEAHREEVEYIRCTVYRELPLIDMLDPFSSNTPENQINQTDY